MTKEHDSAAYILCLDCRGTFTTEQCSGGWGCPKCGSKSVLDDFHVVIISSANAALEEAIKSSDAVCDSYAKENQRLHDRAIAAEAALREQIEKRDE